MTKDNKQDELNGADIFSDWENLIGSPTPSQKQEEEGLSLDNLMTDGGETYWLDELTKTNLSGMDLVALDLIPYYVHDFKAEYAQMKTQVHIFLLKLAYAYRNDLRVAGLSEDQIDELSKGLLPMNWTVHLKYPVAYGGTITAHNFVLMPHHPFHEELHHFINRQIVTDAGVMNPATLYVPTPKSAVYVPFASNEMPSKIIHFQTMGDAK